MALIKCPECEREISDKATTCIHCGCPLSENSVNECIVEEKAHQEREAETDGIQENFVDAEIVTKNQFEKRKEEKFYKKSGFIILMLFVFFPVGAFLMWKYKKFKKSIRIFSSIILGISFLFWSLVFVLASIPCEHQWTETTCTEPKTCSICGIEEGEALGHSVTEWVVNKEATCKEEGSQSGKCITCGNVITATTAKKEHSPGEWEITRGATGSEEGERSKKCVNCGEIIETESFELSDAEKKNLLKQECGVYTYNEIARNPDSYKGKAAKFTGEVIQVMEDGNDYTLRVNITRGEYFWDDTILVSYTKKDSNEARILEDDIITMYGTLEGTYTYETVLGSSLTVPLFFAEYVEFN